VERMRALFLLLLVSMAILGCEQDRPPNTAQQPSCGTCDATQGTQHTPSGRTQISR